MYSVYRSQHDLEMIVELVDSRAKMPEYCDPEDAGMDVSACPLDEEGNPVEFVRIEPGETKLISLGFKVGLPEGWYLSIVPRSGISLKTPLRIANAPGTIDTNYKGIVKIIVTNTSVLGPFDPNPTLNANEEKLNRPGTYVINAGDKIAQMIPMRRYRAKIVPGKAEDIGTDRGGGFGHSGV